MKNLLRMSLPNHLPNGGSDSGGFGPLSKTELVLLYVTGLWKPITAINGPDGTAQEN